MRGIKKAGYGNVYKDIMSNPDLSLQAKGVYAYLSSFTGDQEYCFPSYDTIQKHLGISRASVSKYLKELIAFGVVMVNKRFSGSNQYFLTDLGDFKHESLKNEPSTKVQNMNYSSSNNELTIVQNMNSIKNTSLRTDKKNSNTYSDEFILFWDKWHKITKQSKSGKPKTETYKHFKKLTKKDKQKAIDTIEKYYNSVEDKKYLVIARTYLSKKRYNDEYGESLESITIPAYVYKISGHTHKHSDKQRWERDKKNFRNHGYEEIKITA